MRIPKSDTESTEGIGESEKLNFSTDLDLDRLRWCQIPWSETLDKHRDRDGAPLNGR